MMTRYSLFRVLARRLPATAAALLVLLVGACTDPTGTVTEHIGEQSYVGTPTWSFDGAAVAYMLTTGEECWYEHYPCGGVILATGVDRLATEVILADGGYPSWRR